MQIYDVYFGIERRASVCMQDEGRPAWKFDATWKALWVDAHIPKRIEEAIDHSPRSTMLFYAGFTIQQRPWLAGQGKGTRPC